MIDNITRVFIRLMSMVKFMMWLGSCLKKEEEVCLIETKDVQGNMSMLSILEILHQKHLDLRLPTRLALLSCDDLPSLEEVEISGGHIMHVAQLMQGGTNLEFKMLVTGRIHLFAMALIVGDFMSQ